MQTTLRLPDDLYRAAKARAAEEGITLTRLLEESLRQRLARDAPAPASVPRLRTSRSGRDLNLSHEEFRDLAARVELEDDLRKLGIGTSSPI